MQLLRMRGSAPPRSAHAQSRETRRAGGSICPCPSLCGRDRDKRSSGTNPFSGSGRGSNGPARARQSRSVPDAFAARLVLPPAQRHFRSRGSQELHLPACPRGASALCSRDEGLPSVCLENLIMACIHYSYELAKVPLPTSMMGHSTRAPASSSAFLVQVPILKICLATTWCWDGG
nr:uncharacterized protein LOC112060942 isoform X2 [Chrysemys picta bellii]